MADPVSLMIAIVVTTYFVRRATIDIAAAVRGKKRWKRTKRWR